MRNILLPGIHIKLRSIEDSYGLGTEYEILSVVGEGSSCVCYEARTGLMQGRLKEFNPAAAAGLPGGYVLVRDAVSSQLIPSERERNQLFLKQCEEFLRPYRLLERLRLSGANDPAVRILNNYMPASQVLCGVDEKGNTCGSVYIWTPGDREGIDFQTYLAQVRTAMQTETGRGGEPASRLLEEILTALVALTDCIGILHANGILHLDIKPTNFLLACSTDGNVLPDHISLYDVNSLYDTENSDLPYMIGTAGYMAPELLYGKANHRADLYSIGAILYTALELSEQGAHGFRDEDYGNIPAHVRNSCFLSKLEIPARAALEDVLTEILQSCLAYDRSKRLRSCGELKKTLRKALSILSKRESSIYSKETLRQSNPKAALQRILADVPLYSGVRGEEEIHAAVLGDSTWSRSFTDLSLMLAQNLRNPFFITYYAEHAGNASWRYRSGRPAISSFVSINGKEPEGERRAYASIQFRNLPEGNILLSTIRKKHIRYVFIALRDDRKSLQYALELDMGLTQAEPCVLVCVFQGDGTVNPEELPTDPGRIQMLRVMEPVRLKRKTERMAFQVYLTWRGEEAKEENWERRHFHENYQYNASVANAISAEYKLHMLESAGCIRTGDSYRQKAETLTELLKQEVFQSVCDEMAMREHRRWVLEKVTGGWRGLSSAGAEKYFEEMRKRGEVRQTAVKIHPCIVHCEAGDVLKTISKEQWDDSRFRPEGADELDLVSLSIHRAQLGCRKTKGDVFASNHGLYCNYKDYDYKLVCAIPQLLFGSAAARSTAVPYVPEPVDTSAVELPDFVAELTERLAENIHENWAAARIAEGWKYGKLKSSRNKTTPDLVPYGQLPEEEKEYDRRTALETIRTLLKWGYRIVENGD